jgi:hypothetical protein
MQRETAHREPAPAETHKPRPTDPLRKAAAKTPCTCSRRAAEPPRQAGTGWICGPGCGGLRAGGGWKSARRGHETRQPAQWLRGLGGRAYVWTNDPFRGRRSLRADDGRLEPAGGRRLRRLAGPVAGLRWVDSRRSPDCRRVTGRGRPQMESGHSVRQSIRDNPRRRATYCPLRPRREGFSLLAAGVYSPLQRTVNAGIPGGKDR